MNNTVKSRTYENDGQIFQDTERSKLTTSVRPSLALYRTPALHAYRNSLYQKEKKQKEEEKNSILNWLLKKKEPNKKINKKVTAN